jgi:hypothetical protein
MIKLLPLILENIVDQEEDLGKGHPLSEKGYTFLKSKIDEMNKKASKWGVPPMNLKVVKEEFVKKKIWVNLTTGQQTHADDPAKEEKEVNVKQYQVVIEGEPPSVEGYEFIAKVEHTNDGNILNYAPKASDKSIPTEYRTARQACDVCKTNRDRNNTFILKLEKDDPGRFPEKRTGDFVMIGSGCLKRFLPNISANALMEYADMIENLRNSVDQAGEMDDSFEGGFGKSSGNWMGREELGRWLSAIYLHTGKYLSKKKAQEFQTVSTVDDAFSAMNSRADQNEHSVHKRMREDGTFVEKVDKLTNEFIEWSKTKDFDTLIEQKPEFADFFHNLKVISKQEMFKSKNSGFFSALFQLFLRDQGELEKKNAMKKATADFTYFGEVGGKIRVKVKVNKVKEYESQYGQGLIINMEGEQTATDDSGQSVVKKGNLLYFTSNFELGEGEEAEIEATVKGHQPNKYTQIPETQITRAKIVNFITHPEKNAAKSKVKDLNGVVKVERIYEKMDWGTGTKQYFMDFRYDLNAHPDMIITNSPGWGVNFTYMIPDETSYQSLKQYENKLVNAKWSLARATNMEKFKNGYNQVSKFQVTQVLGDVPPKA